MPYKQDRYNSVAVRKIKVLAQFKDVFALICIIFSHMAINMHQMCEAAEFTANGEILTSLPWVGSL